MNSLPLEVINALGHYVYIYTNPLNGHVFYVGKGRGSRLFSHLDDMSETRKTATIKEIRAAGIEPRIEVLAHDLASAEAAFKIEAAVIDLLGRNQLSNIAGGYHSKTHGRMTLEQLCALYQSEQAEIDEPSLLIRINKLYRHTMTAFELYDATRGIWKIGEDRNKAKLAMSVYQGTVREVYEIAIWLPAGTTLSTRTIREERMPGRWEFVGRVAPTEIREKYLYKSVRNYFSPSSQNSIHYVNIKAVAPADQSSTADEEEDSAFESDVENLAHISLPPANEGQTSA